MVKIDLPRKPQRTKINDQNIETSKNMSEGDTPDDRKKTNFGYQPQANEHNSRKLGIGEFCRNFPCRIIEL